MPRKTDWKNTHEIINNGDLWRVESGEMRVGFHILLYNNSMVFIFIVVEFPCEAEIILILLIAHSWREYGSDQWQ